MTQPHDADIIPLTREPDPAMRGGEFGWRIFVDAAVPPAAAIISFASGLLLLLSASQPNVSERMTELLTVLPLPLVEISHFVASMLGMLLMFLAVGLWRRIDTAWWIAIGVLSAGAALSVMKALHWEEAMLLLLAALALAPFRPSFYRRGHLSDGLVTLPSMLAIFAATGLAIWGLLAAYENVPYQDDLWWTFLRDSDAPRSMRALAGAVTLGCIVAAWQLAGVRQNRKAGPGAAADMVRATAILESAIDGHPDANLMFSGDKSFVFTPSGKSFVMYGQRGGLWIAMGNPVGPAEEQTDALIAFHEAADHAGKSPVIYAAGGDLLPALATIAAGLPVAEAVMPDAVDDLLGEQVIEQRNRLSHFIFQVDRIQFLLRKIAGEEYLPQFVEDVHHRTVRGNGFTIDMRIAFGIMAGLDNIFRLVREPASKA